MTGLFLGLVGALAAIGIMAYAFSRMETRKAAQGLRVLLGIGGVLLGLLLTIRGLAVVGGPMVIAGLGFLGTALRGAGARAGAGTSQKPSQRMSRKEAANVLGVSESAGEAEIRQAYRDMMKRVHPDAGGSDALAAQVQEAFEVLTGKR